MDLWKIDLLLASFNSVSLLKDKSLRLIRRDEKERRKSIHFLANCILMRIGGRFRFKNILEKKYKTQKSIYENDSRCCNATCFNLRHHSLWLHEAKESFYPARKNSSGSFWETILTQVFTQRHPFWSLAPAPPCVLVWSGTSGPGHAHYALRTRSVHLVAPELAPLCLVTEGFSPAFSSITRISRTRP